MNHFRTTRDGLPPSLRPTLYLLGVAVLSLPASAGAQQRTSAEAERMDEVVEYYVDSGRFMGTVLVARDEPILSKGYGSANLEWDIPNSPTTKFRLGSITKQFTAAAILLLEEQGKLTLDDAIKVHLSDAPPAWDDVTIFHLLTHTSGIPSFTSFPEYATLKLSPSPIEMTVAQFKDRPLEFAPGERFNYSNSGYLLLGYLIETISGQNYEAFLTEHLFAPLGMNDTRLDSNEAIIPSRAAGYSPQAEGPVNAEYIHMSIPHAAGALYSTSEDLLRWTEGLFGGQVLSAESLRRMTTPHLSGYALGVEVREADGRAVIEHGGGIEGFNTHLAYYPDEKLSVIVLGNLNGIAPVEIASHLAAVAHGDPVTLPSERTEIALPPEALSKFVGEYEFAPALNFVITLEEGGLVARLGAQPALPLFAESETRFFHRVVDAQIEFEVDESGDVTALVLHQGGREQRAPRVR